MAPPVLSYARPIKAAASPPPNPMATVALWVGGIGWAFTVGIVVQQSLANGSLALECAVAGFVPVASGVLLALTAVVIGPNRRRATIVLGVLLAPCAVVFAANLVREIWYPTPPPVITAWNVRRAMPTDGSSGPQAVADSMGWSATRQ
jgi:hypothetical protein